MQNLLHYRTNYTSQTCTNPKGIASAASKSCQASANYVNLAPPNKDYIAPES